MERIELPGGYWFERLEKLASGNNWFDWWLHDAEGGHLRLTASQRFVEALAAAMNATPATPTAEAVAREIANLTNRSHGCRMEHDVIADVATIIQRALDARPDGLREALESAKWAIECAKNEMEENRFDMFNEDYGSCPTLTETHWGIVQGRLDRAVDQIDAALATPANTRGKDVDNGR